MNISKIILKLAEKLVFVLTFFVGVAAVNVFAQTAAKTASPKPGKVEITDLKQADVDLIKRAKEFAEAFKNADAEKMDDWLADDFRYFTNVPCDYRDCERGATKEDYIKGIVEERATREFTIQSVKMKYLKPIINSDDSPNEKTISFHCEVTMSANGKISRFYSFINYYFQKREETWKIVKIENQIVQ